MIRECICITRGDGPEGCGLCNETGLADHLRATTASANGYEAAEQRSETLTLPKGTEGIDE